MHRAALLTAAAAAAPLISFLLCLSNMRDHDCNGHPPFHSVDPVFIFSFVKESNEAVTETVSYIQSQIENLSSTEVDNLSVS